MAYTPRYQHNKESIGGSAYQDADWLIDLVHTFPDNITFVEVGTWLGGTASDIAKILKTKNGKIICVDQAKQPQWTTNIENAGVADIATFILGCSWEVPSTLNEKYDVIFIDADHSYEAVKKDILAWLPLMKPGGIFMGDDTQMSGVYLALDEIMPGKYDIPKGIEGQPLRFWISRIDENGNPKKYYNAS